jgi:iron(III) transport system substrate-binding protein
MAARGWGGWLRGGRGGWVSCSWRLAWFSPVAGQGEGAVSWRGGLLRVLASILVTAGSVGAGEPARSGGEGAGGRPVGGGEVVVYTPVDELYAREILDAFAKESGVTVLPVFDTEAGKTTGLFNRLLAERRRPRADVFWNNEPMRTLQLVEAGVAADLSDLVPADIPRRWVDPKGRWAATSLRARVLVYNAKMLSAEEAPRSLAELTDPRWKGKVAMANPLFGTTASHMAALYEAWGEKKTEQWLRDLKANNLLIVDGNSVVRDMVGRGDVPVGVTDTDDVFAGIDSRMPIDFMLPDQDGMGTFVVPHSVVLVAGGPNPEAARKLVRYLLSPQVERRQAFSRARQLPVRAEVERPKELDRLASVKAMDVDYGKVARRMPEVARRLEAILLE